MNQNVARIEQQVASAKGASLLSNSINEVDHSMEGRPHAANSSVDQATEEAENQSEALHKDGSTYNLVTNDIAAIP